MVKIFRMFILAAALMLVSQTQAFAGAQDFSVVNNTGSTIYHIYCSSVGSDNWEEDILGEKGVVMPGESVTITFNASDNDYLQCV